MSPPRNLPMKTCLPLLLLSFALPAAAAEKPAGIPENYKLLYSGDFSSPDVQKDFVFTDPDAWRMAKEGEKSFLEQYKQSEYKPKYRSPLNFGLVGGKVFGDFIMDVECQQTSKEYGHRDMVFVF